ncbi:YceI family protein [Ottowia thiooxydans]|uniref:YceI family protein n=1 Tax=Ottowia thiooxydans TaxID=219182 RepID=UPI000416769A|nr:YceI family protein [Ottowia thiooxydans]
MLFRSLIPSAMAAAVALVAAAPALAQQALVPAESSVSFVSKQMGVPVEGQFRKFGAQIAFDAAKPEAAKINLTIDTGSATLGVKETDAELPKPVWFNVPKFPQATFQSKSVKALGGGKFEVAGQLAIKGATRDVTVPVQLTQAGGKTTASGQFDIKRLAYKIGEQEWADTSMVADDVQVKFKLVLTGVGKI